MKNKIICKRCGFDWEPKVKKPRKCPRCSSYDYDKEKVSER